MHDDPEWVRDAVTRLTDLNEHRRTLPWSVDDAPERYVEKQLRAIVGIEFTIEGVEGKAKLSQNRSQEDQSGVVHGLRTRRWRPRARRGRPDAAAESRRRLNLCWALGSDSQA